MRGLRSHTPTSAAFCFSFYNDTATTEFYTLSLHDALPIYTLAPNTSCNVTVDFTPTTVGPASAMLSFFDGDPTSPQTVQLSGTGIVDFALSAPATESVDRKSVV